MDRIEVILKFLKAVEEDPCISTAHISVFLALFRVWCERGGQDPIIVFSRDVMQKAKVTGRATYFRCIRDLATCGYLKYESSYNYLKGSSVSFLNIKTV